MRSGRSISWSGQLDWPVERTSRTARHRREPVPDEPAETEPPADSAPSDGLHAFDLGMVPASVTPPRKWRRAAWFAIASSAATLGGLVFATVSLVSRTPSLEGLEVPTMPRGDFPGPGEHGWHEFAAEEPATSTTTAPSTTAAVPSRLSAATPQTESSQLPDASPPESSPGTAEPVPTTSSPATTVTNYLIAFSDVQQVQQRADAYFAAISRGDLEQAFAMTTGALRAEGYAAFAERYAGATSVEVTGMQVSPSRVVAALRVVLADGSAVAVERELRFTAGTDPEIYADDQVS
ncbi:hypothetical protein [Saccharopolyspora rectivirgula]|jgi:hypothetical protein|uniref:Uncharacterized protein n=1 Tax=Saccharopolyspora rectivirgula TaxID=28042 RepID=A0A073BBL5_9PSEU|nr:hypothetical protein [Saccharopolyspora rectivirgula]KEI45119.1 hypothetical protein GU90_04835 [Saccharopolyspora rectivirgula]